jgi:hypothetical protein
VGTTICSIMTYSISSLSRMTPNTTTPSIRRTLYIMTTSMMTLSVTIGNIIIPSLMTHSVIPFSIMTLSKATHTIMTIRITISVI